jgi:aromatic-L-amino-acid decarboxylase
MSKQHDSRLGQHGLGDMNPAEFRDAARTVANLVADYLENLESYPVVPDLQPGQIREQLPQSPPDRPEPLGSILEDYSKLIEPNITHWQHPGFMAYFPSTASGPGILGEWLATGLNSNVMFWKNAPASTELEEIVVSWLRQMLGLPETFDGMFTDTASVSSLLSLVAARHAVPGLEAREEGNAGHRLRVYVSSETHSSIEKAAIVMGIGRAGVRQIAVDETYRMRPDVLELAITEDRAAGWLPFCVVGTLGTTSSTAMDPAAELARICEREGLWLHIDAAYAGTGAFLPEKRRLFDGWERADSIVYNPHKWLFTPFDASLLLFRRPEVFHDAFCLVPDVLRASEVQGAHNFNEYGIQLGRRFRALKLWILIRYFGTDGIAARIREHCRLAEEFASWVEKDEDWELMMPPPFALVCFRYRPGGADDPGRAGHLDELNEAILDRVNRSGRYYLSSTRLDGRFILRLALGNPRAELRHVEGCWEALRQAARRD